MRITNNIMLNTQRSNINTNKVLMDRIHTQMSTQKKISKPSEDPIVAVRSLRLRANLTELTQYADRNIEDAMSWMEVTESAMENMRAILKDMYENFTQGDNDDYDTAQRIAILENLEASVNRFYDEGNSAYAGRRLFSGYKTDTDYTFRTPDPEARFHISETFTISQIGVRDYITNSVTIDKTNLQEINQATDFPDTTKVNTFNLTYSGMDWIATGNGSDAFSLSYIDANGTEQIIDVITASLNDADIDDKYLSTATGQANAKNAIYVKETGELVFGEDRVNELSKLGGNTVLTAKYNKEGFEKGDINPVMYFDCKDLVNDLEYKKETQDIEYNVGFNQRIKVNTEASDVLQLDVKKEIANLRDAVSAVDEAEKKKKEIEEMIASGLYSDKTEELNSMLAAVDKEIALKKDRMVSLFKSGVGSMQAYEDHVSTEITDLGNRYSQLQMVKTRMQQQKTNFKELLTQNEDRELSDILLDYTASGYSYQLALQATGNISKLSLLNYV